MNSQPASMLEAESVHPPRRIPTSARALSVANTHFRGVRRVKDTSGLKPSLCRGSIPLRSTIFRLLTMMVAQVCGYELGEFIWVGGDCHLYANHIEQAELQLSREPRGLPKMRINPDVKDIFSFKFEDFTLEGYDPHPHIKAKVAV